MNPANRIRISGQICIAAAVLWVAAITIEYRYGLKPPGTGALYTINQGMFIAAILGYLIGILGLVWSRAAGTGRFAGTHSTACARASRICACGSARARESFECGRRSQHFSLPIEPTIESDSIQSRGARPDRCAIERATSQPRNGDGSADSLPISFRGVRGRRRGPSHAGAILEDTTIFPCLGRDSQRCWQHKGPAAKPDG